MPSAMPPMTVGAPGTEPPCNPSPELADATVPAGIGAPARSPAIEPTGRSADGSAGAAGFGSGVAAASATQRPSAPTRSSGPTGPLGPSSAVLASLNLAQSGLEKMSTGLENQPPSLLLSNSCAEFLQPATAMASAAAQTSAILETTRWRGKTTSPDDLSSCPLRRILRQHDGT